MSEPDGPDVPPDEPEDEARPDKLTARRMVDWTGLTYRRLDHWTTLGLLKTVERTEEKSGPGNWREWLPGEDVVGRVMAVFVIDLGMDPTAAEVFARRIIDAGGEIQVATGVYLRIPDLEEVHL